MTTSQQMVSQLDQTRVTDPNERAEGVTTVQNAARSGPGAPTTERNGSKGDTPRPGTAHPPFAYPAWPTSKPGPQATPPLPGQHPHPLRTDQMVYECYDQERGRPCIPSPRLPPVREPRKRIYIPDADFLEVVSEKEALQPTRLREKKMRRFKSAKQAQRFGPIAEHFQPRRHRLSAGEYRTILHGRFQQWNEITEATRVA